VAFEEYVAAALALQKGGDLEGAIHEYRVAEELYQGDFLEDERYEDWPAFQRQHLQTKYLSLLQQLSRYYLQQGDYATCAAMCNKMLSVDPCHEQAHRWLMRCYSRQEQPYLAIRQYHLCVERLREELDASPMEKTVALYREIRQGKQA
jgi:DNA-binding SARP family transcriptional activator